MGRAITEKSMSNIVLLGVIVEIDKDRIKRTQSHKELENKGIIGDFLIYFHNASHFQEKEKSEELC